MKISSRNKKFIVLCSVVCVLVIILGFIWMPHGQSVPYTEFADALQSGQVRRVTIHDNSITYRLIDSGKLYRTDAPQYDTFRAELLLAGVDVRGSAEDSASAVFDILLDVVLIGGIALAVWKYIESQQKTFCLVRNTGVYFSDIAGLDRLKADMCAVLEGVKHPDSSLRPVHGILLEGPPGNGKTMFARALAQECGVNFIASKGADFQSALMSVGPGKIRARFRKARRHSPCIVFIDEFDGIGEKRNYAGAGIDKENNRLLITLLNEIDGFTVSDGVLVVAATNSYASLDPALIRPGRFDLKYTIPNPDAKARTALIKRYCRGMQLAADCPESELISMTDGMSCAAIETIMNEAAATAKSAGKAQIDKVCIADARRKTRL